MDELRQSKSKVRNWGPLIPWATTKSCLAESTGSWILAVCVLAISSHSAGLWGLTPGPGVYLLPCDQWVVTATSYLALA